jgi:hypothetical protein
MLPEANCKIVLCVFYVSGVAGIFIDFLIYWVFFDGLVWMLNDCWLFCGVAVLFWLPGVVRG